LVFVVKSVWILGGWSFGAETYEKAPFVVKAPIGVAA
jgi:hypothetical protein